MSSKLNEKSSKKNFSKALLIGKVIATAFFFVVGLITSLFFSSLFIISYGAFENLSRQITTYDTATITYALLLLVLVILTAIIGKRLYVHIMNYRKRILSDIDRRDKLLAAVNEATVVLLKIDETSSDIKVPVRLCLELIGQSMSADRLHIWQFEEKDNKCKYFREFTWVSDFAKKQHKVPYEIKISSTETDRQIVNSFCEGNIISGTLEEICDKYGSNYVEFVKLLHPWAITIIPLFLEGKHWGLFSIDNCKTPQEYNEDDISILSSISLIMATTIMRHKLHLEVAEANARSMLMLDASPFSIIIFDKNNDIIDCNEFSLQFFGYKSKDDLKNTFFLCCNPELQPDGSSSYELDKVRSLQAFEEGICAFDWMHKFSTNGTPLPCGVTLVRVKYSGDNVIIAYIRDKREFVKMEGQIQSLEIENKKIHIDSLTKIFNRRYFDENITRIIKSFKRTNGMLSLMIIDIDYFKKYNDTYGHLAGDECIKKVCGIIKKCVSRVDDFVARYGGEEFIVVMPNTNEAGAISVAERIMKRIRSAQILHESSEISDHLTVSIGITSGEVREFHTPKDFIDKADVLLYESKSGGRDRMTFSEMS